MGSRFDGIVRSRHASKPALALALLLALAARTGVVRAQGEGGSGTTPEPSAPSDDAAGSAAAAGTALIGDEQAVVEERTGREQARDSTDPYEDPHESYYFLGAFYRHVFVPEFLLNLFLEESTGASNPGAGAFFTYRKDQFSINAEVWFVGYRTAGPYLAANDPLENTEFIDSELDVLFATASFTWSTPFNDIVALEYGVDIGLGLVLGTLTRTEARPARPGNAQPDVNGYEPCPFDRTTGPTEPDAYCAPNSDGRPTARDGEDGEHYGIQARKWSDGGDVPNVIPWLAIPRVALRIKPIRQLQIRIEGGFGVGMFAGVSAAYGFD
ncbi:MAG: hypothetical protein NZ898_14695 [Myxococcota bacterium]|nr:hypothetical protein [Myxococcota bacterium]